MGHVGEELTLGLTRRQSLLRRLFQLRRSRAGSVLRAILDTAPPHLLRIFRRLNHRVEAVAQKSISSPVGLT